MTSAEEEAAQEVPGRLACASACATGLLFCVAGMAVALHLLAGRVLPHITTPGPGLDLIEPSDGRPVPRLLDWNFGTLRFLTEVHEMSSLWIVGAAVVIALLMWHTCIRVLNPTYRPFRKELVSPVADTLQACALEETHAAGETGEVEGPTIPPNSPAAEMHIVFDRVHFLQAVRVLIITGLPVAAIFMVTGGFGNTGLVGPGGSGAALRYHLIRCIALGVALFVGYSRFGLAGRFGILHQAYQSDDLAVPVRSEHGKAASLAVAASGALFGLAIFGVSRLLVNVPTEALLWRFQMLGTFNKLYLRHVTGPFLFSTASASFAAGALFYLLARPRVRLRTRLLMIALPLVAALATRYSGRSLTSDSFAKQYDATPAVLATAHPFDPKRASITVPAGVDAGKEFARVLHVPVLGGAPPPMHDLVVFSPAGTYDVELDEICDDGLIVDAARCADVQAFLKRRNYQSALSWMALKYLFNDANLRFDSTAALRYGLDDLENGPHESNVGDTIRTMFFLCAATPQNLALLDEYADESRFAHSSRTSQRLMGELYSRFGNVDKALKWYRRADMPRSFMQQVRAGRPLFTNGEVSGKLMLNGKPLAGVQVGAAPQRLNGLPRDMEYRTLHYFQEIAGQEDQSPLFTPYHPRPYRLRWICGGAKTGTDGSFRIDHLSEGEYFLVCTLPAGIKLEVPVDTRLKFTHAPSAFTLNYSVPNQHLGVITLSYKR